MDNGYDVVVVVVTVAYFSFNMGSVVSNLGSSYFRGVSWHLGVGSDGYWSSDMGSVNWGNYMGITVAYLSFNMSGGVVGTSYLHCWFINWNTVGADDWEVLWASVDSVNWGGNVVGSISDWNVASYNWGNYGGVSVADFGFNMGSSVVGTRNLHSGFINWNTVGSDDWEMLGAIVVGDNWSGRVDSTAFAVMDEWSVVVDSVAGFSFNMGSEVGGFSGDYFWCFSRYCSGNSDWGGVNWSNNSGISVAYFGFYVSSSVFSTGSLDGGFINWDTVGSNDW